ncbi:hypothetical protein WAI453_003268 [Rhynchosporium graminicola]
MPKNTINLNALPLGDLPQGGLSTLPGDKVTIKDRIIIHESAENGLKVVKLYRQDNGPQMIQQLPVPALHFQQVAKRSASPLPENPAKRKKKGWIDPKSQLTTDQDRRLREIAVERQLAAEELKACSAEKKQLEKLRAGMPTDPEVDRRVKANIVRKKEAERNSNRIGSTRRALMDGLNAKSGKPNDMTHHERSMHHAEYEAGIQLLDKRLHLAQRFLRSHSMVKVEHNSNSNMLSCESFKPVGLDIVDPYRQSYTGAPGFQDHRQNLLQQLEDIPSYFDTSVSTFPDSKIHPARLSLMNTTTAAMPELQSTEPQVLMKVTGENVVPLARSRMTGTTSVIMKHEDETMEAREILEYTSSDKDSHVKIWEKVGREIDQDKPEGHNRFYSPILLGEASKSKEAIAWLDANIPLNDYSGLSRRKLVDNEDRCDEVSGTYDVNQVGFQGPFSEPVQSNLVRLGLQHYQDDEEDSAVNVHQDHFASTSTNNMPIQEDQPHDCFFAQHQEIDVIEREPRDRYAFTSDQGMNGLKKQVPNLDMSVAVQQRYNRITTVNHNEYSPASRESKDERLTMTTDEKQDKSKHVTSALSLYQEPMDLLHDLHTGKRPIFGERSINIGVGNEEHDETG